MVRPSTLAMVSPAARSLDERRKSGIYAMMNASTIISRLHLSQDLCWRIRSSIVMGTPSETLMLRHELPSWQGRYPGPCGIFAVDRRTYVQLELGVVSPQCHP